MEEEDERQEVGGEDQDQDQDQDKNQDKDRGQGQADCRSRLSDPLGMVNVTWDWECW